MRVSEITLQDLKNYFDEVDGNIYAEITVDKDGDESLDLFAYDGVEDDCCFCSVYKVNANGDIYFNVNGLTFPNGAEEEDFDEDNCTIEEVVSELLSMAKINACLGIEGLENEVLQINTFCSKNNIKNYEYETSNGKIY